MLKYLIIQLDDISPSFCHYTNKKSARRLIDYNALRNGLVWAMKENLMVQFVYPDYEIPDEYKVLIDSVDHIDIERENPDSDVSVFDGKNSLEKLKEREYAHCVLRLSKHDFFSSVEEIQSVINRQPSLNIVITDIDSFDEADFEEYEKILDKLSAVVVDKMKQDKPVSINLLTDILQLDGMNNCNAGSESITLAPDGNFYICPAFYIENEEAVGNPDTGVSIPNSRLYELSYAPICRKCDAFQCKRCIWLNKKTTLEVNTPGREQCVAAHMERRVSSRLLSILKDSGIVKTDKSIPELDYLDPFDIIKR